MTVPTSHSVAMQTIHAIAFKVGVNADDHIDVVGFANAVIEEAQCEGITVMTQHVREHWAAVAERVNINVAMATGARNIIRGDIG